MEHQDWNMIGADCVVLSCCCQCLMLQLLVFVVLKLPTKFLRRTIRYMKRKFGDQMRHGGKVVGVKVACCAKEVIGCQKVRDSTKVREKIESFRLDGCMEEVEEVMEELSRNGEFGFGSFWKGDDDNVQLPFPICLVKQELGCHDDVFGPFRVH